MMNLRSSLSLLLLSLPFTVFTQVSPDNVEWKSYTETYFPFGNEFSDGEHLFTMGRQGLTQREARVYDKKTFTVLNKFTSQELQIPGLKKAGKFKIETLCSDDEGVYAVGRIKNKSTKLHEVWSIPLENSPEVFNMAGAKKVFEAKSVWFQQYTESSQHEDRPFFVLRYPKPNEDGTFDSEMHQLGVFDPANGDKIWSRDIKPSEGKNDRSKLVIEADVIALESNNKLILSDFILNTKSSLDLRSELDLDARFDLQILGFRKTNSGYTAAIIPCSTGEEKKLVGTVFLLPFNSSLTLKQNEIREWDLFDNDLGIDTISNISAKLNQNGDLFIFSDRYYKNAYDVFVLNNDGSRWTRSIPCRSDESVMEHIPQISATYSQYGIKVAVGKENLYLLYIDNKKNIDKYGMDMSSFDRRNGLPEEAPATNEGGIFTCLKVTPKGKTEVFQTFNPAKSEEKVGSLFLTVTSDKVFVLAGGDITHFNLE